MAPPREAAPHDAPRSDALASEPIPAPGAAEAVALHLDPPGPTQAAGQAPAPTPAASQDALGPQIADADAASDYRQRLLAYLERFKRYPDEDAARRRAGEVQLAFGLDRTGRVFDLRVERSSGSRLLDDAAVDTVRRADPLPSIPEGLPDQLSIELPVQFGETAGL